MNEELAACQKAVEAAKQKIADLENRARLHTERMALVSNMVQELRAENTALKAEAEKMRDAIQDLSASVSRPLGYTSDVLLVTRSALTALRAAALREGTGDG